MSTTSTSTAGRGPSGDGADLPDVGSLLAAAVEAIGGSPREGQQEMAVAVADAIETGEHLLVQAGTGTGKSLAYLVPALAHGEPVVVATATIALQRQLFDRDLPRVADALEPLLGRRPTFALAKGRSNYLCVHRLHAGEEENDEDALFDAEEVVAPSSKAGRDVLRIRSWAERTKTGDKDEISPAPDDRAWRALSVTAHECLGAQRCPFASECWAEQARERARQVDLVVTNHSMLTIDALADPTLLPEHSVVIVDEAHELADRATGAITDELTAGMVSRASRRSRKFAGTEAAALVEDAADALEMALTELEPGRVDDVGGALFDAMTAVRDAGHTALSAIGSTREGADDLAQRVRAKAAVDEVFDIAGRVVSAGDNDVVWVSKPERRPPTLHRAPLFVGGLLREKLFGTKTVILTSATLTVGGDFTAVARTVGLVGGKEGESPAWRGLDVGSPFDYGKQAILYVASHLPAPGRDGLSDEMLDELAELIAAAGGRTLGLFSSMRAAREATERLRDRLDVPLLCQGEDSTAELVRVFASDAQTCLFGTLSLWQGVDVPGSACQLVVIDRLPFPRPDDPLSSARMRAVTQAGGNGFMAVAVPATALRLAQGAGRLIRTDTDRGVVAVLDSRLATARYAPALRRSLPPMWSTTDAAVARRSLTSIAGSAPPVLPVSRPLLELAAEADDEVDPAASEGASPSGARAGRGTKADDGDDGKQRHGRHWTPEEEQTLRDLFDEGLPPSLVAESMGRTRGAIVGRLRKIGVTGRVIWAPTDAERSREDVELAHDLCALSAAAVTDAGSLAEALDAEGWQVSGAETEGATLLRVRRGPVDADVLLVADGQLAMTPVPSPVLARTSRWLVQVVPADAFPAPRAAADPSADADGGAAPSVSSDESGDGTRLDETGGAAASAVVAGPAAESVVGAGADSWGIEVPDGVDGVIAVRG